MGCDLSETRTTPPGVDGGGAWGGHSTRMKRWTDRDNDRRLDCGTLCSSLISSTVTAQTIPAASGRHHCCTAQQWFRMTKREQVDWNIESLRLQEMSASTSVMLILNRIQVSITGSVEPLGTIVPLSLDGLVLEQPNSLQMQQTTREDWKIFPEALRPRECAAIFNSDAITEIGIHTAGFSIRRAKIASPNCAESMR